jgi:tetratricopeptide (TPR) repeat protein
MIKQNQRVEQTTAQSDDIESLNIRGYYHLLTGEAEQALGFFHRAVELDSNNLDRAATLFEQALHLDPSFLPASYHLGVAYLHQCRCQEAIEALAAVVTVEPDHPQVAASLGVAYNTAGKPGKAIGIFEDLLQRQPDNPLVVLNLGYAYQDAGLIDRAVECFNRVVTSMPDTVYAQKAHQALSGMQRTAS